MTLVQLPPAATVEALPPHDIGAEEACVAACVLDQDAVFVLIGAGLQPADFYDHVLGRLYGCAVALAERNEQIDYLTLTHEASGFLHEAGGSTLVLELMQRHFTAAGVEAHARMVMRDAQYRRLIQAGTRVVRLGYEGGPDVAAALEESRAFLQDIEIGGNSGGALVREYIENDIPEDDRDLVTTGYPALDRAVRGCAAGELICLGARTDQGKTALAVGMAYRQANAGVPVAYLPVEGSVGGVLHRMAAVKAGVSLGYLQHLERTGRSQPGEDLAYWQHYSSLADLPLVVPTKGDTPRRTHAILSWITRQVRQFGIKVAYIDHIDAIALDLGRGQNVASAYADFMKRLQELAGREQISIVFLSQVNREAGRVEGKTPPMAYMRESGSKEEASQTVLMLGLEQDDVENNSLHPNVGRWLWVNVDKVKDYPGNRNIGSRAAPDRPVLWLDAHSGALRQWGEQL
jgi:replicative DNA helicase